MILPSKLAKRTKLYTLRIHRIYFRPTICGKENDRICSYGPSLQFGFDIDELYQSTTLKVIQYFDTNYDAVYKYINRLEYVHAIYEENEDLDRAIIENETSKYIKVRVSF